MEDLLKSYNERKYPRSSFLGTMAEAAAAPFEIAASGVSSIAGALPAMMYGGYEALRTGDINAYPEVFNTIREALTYKPKTDVVKDIGRASSYLVDKGRRVADWLGEEVTGGGPTAPLVSAGIRGLATIAGYGIPMARAISKAAKTTALAKEKVIQHKSILAAIAAGEEPTSIYSRTKLRPAIDVGEISPEELTPADKAVFYKDTTVPTQETVLQTLQDQVQRDREGPIAPVEGRTPNETREDIPRETIPTEISPKAPVGRQVRPTVEDFHRIFADSEDAKIAREVMRIEAQDNAALRGESPPTPEQSIPPPSTFKVVTDPSYEKLRSDAVSEDPKSLQPMEETATAPEQPTVDLIANKNRYNIFLEGVVHRFQMETQGQDILDTMEDSGISPNSVATKFWKDVYPILNQETQKIFNNIIQKLLGKRPGDVIVIEKNRTPIVAKSWQDLGKFYAEDAPLEVLHLEGSERGFVSFMKYVSDKSEALRPIKKTSTALGQSEQAALEEPMSQRARDEVMGRNILPFENVPAIVNQTTSLIKPLRNISDVRVPEGYERAEYLGEKQGDFVVQSKSLSGEKRITGSGSTFSEALQNLQENLDKVQSPIIKKLTPSKTISKSEPLSESQIADAQEKLKSKLEFEAAKAEANKPMALQTELNTGFNISKGVYHVLQKAKAKLKDAFLRPESGVKVHAAKDPIARLRWRDWTLSPGKVAAAHRIFKGLAFLGDRHNVELNKMVMRGGHALEITDNLIKKTPDTQLNRAALDKILLTGDMEGRKYSQEELTTAGAVPEVQQAYNIIRRILDATHRNINMARKRAGLEPTGYLHGYISHNLKDWHILKNGNIVGSARTYYEAVKTANAAKRGGEQAQIHIIPRRFDRVQEGFSKVADDAIQHFEDNFLKQMKFTVEDASTIPGPRVGKSIPDFGNLRHRTGTSSVTSHVDTALREYLNNAARYVAALRFKTDAYKAFNRDFGNQPTADFPRSSVAHYAKQYINDVTGGQVYLDQFLNDMFSGADNKFGQFITKYLGKDVVGSVSKFGADAANFAWIANNISSFLLNYVSMISGGAVVGHVNLWKTYGLRKLGRFAGRDQKILEAIGVSRHSPQLNAFPGAELTKLGRLNKISYAAFSATDYDVKSTIGIAAYEKAQREGLSHPQALKMARTAVVNTIGELAYNEAPAAIRAVGKAGRPIFQMKRILHKQVENALTYRGKEAIRFWGPFLAVVGYHGIPFSQDIMNLISYATGGEVDPELAMKETLMSWSKDDPDKSTVAKIAGLGATVAQSGLLGAIGGVDVGQRVGISDPITSTFASLPPAASLVKDTWKKMANGDWTDAIWSVSKPIHRAYQYLRAREELFQSPYQRSRNTLTEPTWGENIQKAIGLTPVREKRIAEAKRIETWHKQTRTIMEQGMIDDYIKARGKDDQESMDALAQKAITEKVHNFRQRVMQEFHKKTVGREAAVERTAGKRRKHELEKYMH